MANLGSGEDEREALMRHSKRYLEDFECVRLLDYGGNASRLPRDKCFIRRATVDGVNAGRPQRRFKEEAPEWVEPVAAVQDEQLIERIRRKNGRRLFITGEGGMGKTEYTRLIAFRLAQSIEIASPRSVPLLFELKNLTMPYDNGEDFFRTRLAPGDFNWLCRLARLGEVVFILDGLDEVPIDRRDCNTIIDQLMRQFDSCAFVLAGRPGSLGNLDSHFDDAAKHELKALELGEIELYILSYFAYRERPALGSEMIALIHQNMGSMLSLLQTPFMLAYACDLYCDPEHARYERIPSNPADLVDLALRRMFSRRRRIQLGTESPLPTSDELCIEVLSTLAAFTLVRPDRDQGVQLSFSASMAEKWLLQNREHFKSLHRPLRHDGDAKELLATMVPHSGVLFRMDNGKLAFSKRLVAEFLAAKWIVRHGYPHWPYRLPIAAYTTAESPIVRQVMDFLGDHIWSVERIQLVMAVYFELGRTQDGCALLIRLVNWIVLQLEGAKAFSPSCHTVLFMIFRAFCGDSARGHLSHIELLAHRFAGCNFPWWRSNICNALVLMLPGACKNGYRNSLLQAEVAPSLSLEGLGSDVLAFVSAVSLNFPDDPELRQRAHDLLSATLKLAAEDPQQHHLMIQLVTRRAIASGFGGDAALRQQAFSTLLIALTAATREPANHLNAICGLGSAAIAAEFAGYSGLIPAAHAAVRAGLGVARAIGTEHCQSVSELARLAAWGFADDAELNGMAREALSRALINHGAAGPESLPAIGVLIAAVKLTFPNDTGLRTQMLDSLSAGIFKFIYRTWLQHSEESKSLSNAFKAISFAIAAGHVDPQANREKVRDLLARGLGNCLTMPTLFWWVICQIAKSIAAGFGSDEVLTQQAREALSTVADAMAANSGEDMEEVSIVAATICTAFPSDAGLMQKAFDTLLTVLDLRMRRHSTVSPTLDELCEGITSRFAGKLKAAVAMQRAGRQLQLQNSDRWLSYLVLCGDSEGLESWAGPTGEKWGLDGSEPVIAETGTSIEEEKVKLALLVAPREKIRRGLSAELFSVVTAELQPAGGYLGQPDSEVVLPSSTGPSPVQWPDWYNRKPDLVKVQDAKRLLKHFGFQFTRKGHDSETLNQILTKQAETLMQRRVGVTGNGAGRRIDRVDLEHLVIAKVSALRATGREKNLERGNQG